jgi:hypothetical protein
MMPPIGNTVWWRGIVDVFLSFPAVLVFQLGTGAGADKLVSMTKIVQPQTAEQLEAANFVLQVIVVALLSGAAGLFLAAWMWPH